MYPKNSEHVTPIPSLGLGVDFLNNVIRLNVARYGVEKVLRDFPGQVETAYRFGAIDVLREHPTLLSPQRLMQKPHLRCWLEDKSVRDFWSKHCIYPPQVCAALFLFDTDTLRHMPVPMPLFYAYATSISDTHDHPAFSSVHTPFNPVREWDYPVFRMSPSEPLSRVLLKYPVEGWLIMEFFERYIFDNVVEAYHDRKAFYLSKVDSEVRNHWMGLFDSLNFSAMQAWIQSSAAPQVSAIDCSDIDFAGSSFTIG